MSPAHSVPAGALSTEAMQGQLISYPLYRGDTRAPALLFSAEVQALWGGTLTPMMAHADTRGRFAQAALACPPTACTGSMTLLAEASSQPWRNPSAIENLFCAQGSVELTFGPDLEHTLTLGEWDMVSVPAGVRHRIRNISGAPARLVAMLSTTPQGSYEAVFDEASADVAGEHARAALGVRFDSHAGEAVERAVLEARTTRFATLVPYKNDLNRTAGLPAEATMRLSAGSVFPLIVPEGHIGRSRTAPMYGNQGLYLSIAECTAGDDGPPPHAHSDTQESFYVLDGAFDICTGLANECRVSVRPHDLFATPSKVMRTFRNTSGQPARLLVIIQGPDRMQDTVSFSRTIGDEFKARWGEGIIAKYADIRMTFDAEERLGV